MKKENFENLYNIDLKKYIEKDYKGLSYLSWAMAYKLAIEKDLTMTYQVLTADDGLPFFSRGDIHFVKTRITMFGEVKEMMLPVMDNKHNAVSKPNSRQINDNIMRCLVKNIAMFGLGLSLYINEDLTEIQEKKEVKENKIDEKKEVQSKEKKIEVKKGDEEIDAFAVAIMVNQLMSLPNDKIKRIIAHFKAKDLFTMTDNQIKEAYDKIFIN